MKKLAILALLGLCSCGAPEQYVRSDRETYNAIAPEYLDYVNADTSLDQAGKDRRHRTVQAWDFRISSAESLFKVVK